MPRRILGGLIVRREAWTLSRAGKVAVLMALASLLCALGLGIHPFLAANNGGDGEVLVVEGWISMRRVERVVEAFRQGHYRSVVVVRDVYRGANKWTTGRYTADYMAADLVEQGVPKESINLLFCSAVRKDRTYHCALAVREWLEQNQMTIASIDVATMAAHARRSRLLYRKAFGDGVKGGAIAIEDPSYDPARWWRSSSGVRDVVGEAIAYAYARLFFWPGAPEASD